MAERLKNIFFTREKLEGFARVIKKYYPDFETNNFLDLLSNDSFNSLELTRKMRHTTECLHGLLPGSYKENIQILKKCAPYINGFEALCLPDYVALYGMNDWDLSLEALYYFTKYSTSELAIRAFINKEPEKVMSLMSAWAEDDNPKVRRFASEGCRPRLPWAIAIPGFKKDPGLVLEVLEKLKNDPSEDVRRSVANNLNDISKDNPEKVLSVCRRWMGKTKETDKLVKYACRSLLKAGNKESLLLFGYSNPENVSIDNFKISSEVLIVGETLEFSIDFSVTEKSKVRLEYAIYYVKARGQLSKKVFKITENDYVPGCYSILRRQSFVQRTTRKHFQGKHQISIIVNGQEKCSKSFSLKK